ncbi:MAG: LysM peptidoglycan-binding domain-containing protein [Gemmatimonadetes bacterium]|nr:LysM peptidoglycan-binding domain-containing protein [Gemmatimonadota bacterium]
MAFVAGAARAQDTTQVAQPRMHVVQGGETLWALAGRYLGDPLLWPAIYRLNTLVVEDPHWIFPGEELRLVPPDTTMITAGQPVVGIEPVPADTAAPDTTAVSDTSQGAPRPTVAGADLPPPPPAPGEGVATVFTPRGRTRVGPITGRVGLEYYAVVPGQFYAAGFLTEGDRLPWASVRGMANKATLGTLTAINSARVFESVEIAAPEGASYQVGDSVLIAVQGREIADWGEVIIPTGIALVREVAGRRVVADVVTQFGRVSVDQVAMPVEPFRSPGTVVPLPIENGMTGSLITVRDLHPLPGQMAVVFIDRGREDGVVLGDVFEILRPNPPDASPETPLQQAAVLQIVHVRGRSASGMLVKLSGLGVAPGIPVRLIRKMPS